MKKISLPKIIGHRGAKGLAPENTLSSIIKAFSFGIKFVEVDVQISKDKVPLLLHDYNVDRTTNGKGQCRNFTFEELLILDAGSWFDKKFKNEKILSLKECINYIKYNERGINIEIKSRKDHSKQSVEAISKIFNETKYELNCFFSSFDILSLKLLQNNIPMIPRGFLIDKSNNKSLNDILEICSRFDCFSIGLDIEIIDYEMIKFFKKNNLTITTFTVNNNKAAKNMFDLGVDSIFTDRPDILKF